MGDVRLNDPLRLPVQTDPDADEAIRRDWAEANLAGGGGGAPSGPAGGVLSGTYPNPGFAADMATQGELDAHVGTGGSAHALAVASGANGFISGANQAKLDGIEAGATADQAASEILTAVKTVDGSGSGLDADTLDGTDSTGFSASGHNHDATYVNESDFTAAAVIGKFSGTPDGTKFPRDDGTLATPASGYTPPWIKTGSGTIYTSWGDGNPFHVNRLLDAGLSPTRANMNSVISPGVLFRLPKSLVLANIYAPTLLVATTGLHVAIYRRSDSALIGSANIASTLAGGWSSVAISGTLAANTDYWLLYHGGVNTGTSPFLRTPNNPFDTWIYGSPSAPLNKYDSGIPIQIQVSVTTQGTWPDPMPAAAAMAQTNRGAMLALLEGTAS